MKTKKHWSNEQTMMDYLYQREEKHVETTSDQPALLIFDNFNAQCSF